MNKRFDSSDLYRINIYNKILKLAPVVGALAALTFTLARMTGRFSYVDLTHLYIFDATCVSYFIAAYLLNKLGIVKDGKIDLKKEMIIDLTLDALILLQWNLITYIFPTRTFWGYAPMFVLLTAFVFHAKTVLIEIAGISISMIVSWFILGDQLLPYKDSLYFENLTLRIVALITSFSIIYILTYFSEKFANQVKENYEALEKKNLELENMGKDIIDFTADMIEERDATSGSHVKRLTAYTRLLAKQIATDYPEYNLTEEKIEEISRGCVLHDVGKIGIPDSILLKPGKLTSEEFEIIKTHTTNGAKIIDKLPDSVGEDYKRYCKEICLFHHEKYDGKGYPSGLVGDDIPISAQIVSVVDCYDALCNDRPYKKALPGEVAINMIINGECGAFSQKIKSSLLKCKEKFLNIS